MRSATVVFGWQVSAVGGGKCPVARRGQVSAGPIDFQFAAKTNRGRKLFERASVDVCRLPGDRAAAAVATAAVEREPATGDEGPWRDDPGTDAGAGAQLPQPPGPRRDARLCAPTSTSYCLREMRNVCAPRHLTPTS